MLTKFSPEELQHQVYQFFCVNDLGFVLGVVLGVVLDFVVGWFCCCCWFWGWSAGEGGLGVHPWAETRS